MKLTEVERFWFYVLKTDKCWLWERAKDWDLYGIFRKDRLPGQKRGTQVRAHRYSWELLSDRPIPKGLLVCHTCDNPSCVNPSHLFLGTNADNTSDRHSKGRDAKGTKHGMNRLTEADVHLIRESTLGHSELGRMFGVSPQTIYKIRKGILWKSLPV